MDAGKRPPAHSLLVPRQQLPGTRGLGPWVCTEVDVLQPLGRQVRVDLGGREVGVTEHLLQRAQIAPAREQVGGEAVAKRMRAHLLIEAGAAAVDEQLRLHLVADQRGTPTLLICAQRRDRLAADRNNPLLGALAARAQHSLVEVDVARLQPDRLRGTQPTCVHDLEQSAIAQRPRLGPLGLAEQLGDLIACEHPR